MLPLEIYWAGNVFSELSVFPPRVLCARELADFFLLSDELQDIGRSLLIDPVTRFCLFLITLCARMLSCRSSVEIRGQFVRVGSPTVWVLGIKPRLLGLVAGAFSAHISLVLVSVFNYVSLLQIPFI